MQDIMALGVTSFETFVFDIHTDYFGNDNFSISSVGFVEHLTVADNYNIELFKSNLKSHQ